MNADPGAEIVTQNGKRVGVYSLRDMLHDDCRQESE